MSINPQPIPPQTHESSRDSNENLNPGVHDLKTPVSGDPRVRKVVAAELLAAISNENREIQQRARQLFIEHGYFDEAVRHLREGKEATDRVAAANTLGQFGSNLATAALNASLFDEDSAVREAAQSAIECIENPRTPKESVPRHKVSGTTERKAEKPERQIQASKEKAGIEPSSDESESQTTSTAAVSASALLDAQALEAESSDVNKLMFEENDLQKALDALEEHELELGLALESARNEMQSANESVLRFRAEIDELCRQEEEVRRRTKTATDHYEAQIRKKMEAEQDCERFSSELVHVRTEAETVTAALLQVTRKRADTSEARRVEAKNARRLADERYNIELQQLRSEEEALRAAAEKAALRRAEVRDARLALQEQTTQLLEQQNGLSTPEAARLAEVERMHHVAEERHRTEQEQLRNAVERLNRVTQHVAARRASIEFATRVAEAEAEKLAEAQARLDASEKMRHTAEAERRRLEPNPFEGTPEHRSDANDVVREQELNHEIERLEEVEIDLRRRIEQAELRRRGAEEACRLLEERAIKVEAEAHRSRLEEEQALTKLETARRQAATELETRADQQKRIREDIEELRRLELEERRRVEKESLRRSQAEASLQQERDRFRVEEAARLRIEKVKSELDDQHETALANELNEIGDPQNNFKSAEFPPNESRLMTLDGDGHVELTSDVNDIVPEELVSALRNENAESRRVAVDTLASIGNNAALAMIVEAFDDDSPEVRNSAALALRKADREGARDWFTKAFEEGSQARQKNIGQAIVDSGLASDSISTLTGSNFDETHNALSVLLVMARAGDVQPLVQAIEEHKNLEVRRAAIRLLSLSGHADVADAAVKRRLAGI